MSDEMCDTKDQADDDADHWKHTDPTERTPNQVTREEQADRERQLADTLVHMRRVWQEIQRLMAQ